MLLSTLMPYGGDPHAAIADVVQLEAAGLDMVWVPEVWGFDSASLMGYVAARTTHLEIGSAIFPIYSRTPGLLAMTAAGIDALSGGRFSLGVGASGPQVVEGFHGVPYEAPLARTREIVSICRQAWKRRGPLEHHGRYYDIPYQGEGGTGLGKPLKLMGRPVRSSIPIWLAALGEKNVALAAEIADGWIPIFFIPERAHDIWGAAIATGSAARSPELGPLQITAGGLVAIGEDEQTLAMRDLQRPALALYIGGMGAKGKNFYYDLCVRYGFEREAATIQELYLAGKKGQAEAAIPDELVEKTTLCGPASYVAERVAAFSEAGVTNLQVVPLPQGDQTSAHLIERIRGMIG
jgi:F420-dependent oxidoreductase-like protein